MYGVAHLLALNTAFGLDARSSETVMVGFPPNWPVHHPTGKVG
jgi:hypothetical protein